MSLRIVQTGQGDERDVLVLYHLTADLDAAVRASVGPGYVIVNVTEVPFQGNYKLVTKGGKLAPLDQLVANVHDRLGANFSMRRLCLAGFSEGCQGVRAQLAAGFTPHAVLLIDGTHGSWPKRLPSEVEPYAAVFRAAVADGLPLFVASHSGLTYVETLKPTAAQPKLAPYASTKTVLQEITGWTLGVPAGHKEPEVRRAGGAVVYSYASQDHVKQATTVLPLLLRTEVAARWAEGAPDAPFAPPPTPAPASPPAAPASPVSGAPPELLPDALTPPSVPEIVAALRGAWGALFLEQPTNQQMAVLLAQYALETGRGKSMHNHNIGNIKGKPDGSDGRCWQFFACNEIFDLAYAQKVVAGAKPRTDGKTGPNAVLTSSYVKDGKNLATVWFYPSHSACCFRAYRTLLEGAVDYIGLLKQRFTRAWPALLAGDVVAFTAALKAQGYFTADLASYTKGMVSLYKEFLAVMVNTPAVLVETTAPEPHPDDEPVPGAEQAYALAQLTLTESLRDDLLCSMYGRCDEPDPSEA